MHIRSSFIEGMMKILRSSPKKEAPPLTESSDVPVFEEVKVGEALETTIQADRLQATEGENGASMPFAEELPPSLLGNRSFVKLAEECADVMDEFDVYIERLESEEGKMIAKMAVKRLQELLERSGLQRIDDVSEPFSILRHDPVPMMPVSEGKRLEKILQPGLALDNRVFRKARVKIQRPEDDKIIKARDADCLFSGGYAVGANEIT